MKIDSGVRSNLRYSETLYEWSLAALVTEGKIEIDYSNVKTKSDDPEFIDKVAGKKYASAYKFARERYKEAIGYVKIQPTGGHREWAQEKILQLCFDINTTIFPIALSEGILDLKDITNKATAGMDRLSLQREQ